MNFEIDKSYHGFKLVDKYPVEELDSTAQVFEHEKSGAKLLHLDNSDDNKVFSVAFKTPPEDSTGVPHIVEHCVLSGSRKYATKEPFMDMVKGSLKTFINAMTFSDKTIYPVASRNDKDFFNLMDVYLDSVFFPKIYEVPEIFMQEGWHFDIHSKDEPLTYTGVVYNEMRGAYSTPDSILDDVISQSLFPDTCYNFSSGGDPDVIPDLTMENFTDFHKKYYHPSNSFIYLYGNGNIEKYLQHMDEDYLSNFERMDVDSDIALQEPFAKRNELEGVYPISEDESDENKDYLTLNYVLGDVIDPEVFLASQILKNILVTSTAAPLKKALLDAGLGEDIMASINDGSQIAMSIIAKNTDSKRKQDFDNVVTTTLMQLVRNGIDKDLIKSSINIAEYDLREASRFPTKGIIYHISSMSSWLYGGHPTSYLEYNKILSKLRETYESGYFETFITDRILNNPHQSMVVLKPEKGLGEKKAVLLAQKLSDIKSKLTDAEIESLIEKNEKLRKKQLSPDSAEALATIPKLSVSDVNKDAELIPQEIVEDGTVTLLHHDIFANNISYIDFLFDVSMVPIEKVQYVNLLSQLITKMDTQNNGYAELSNEIYNNTGGINLSAIVFLENNRDDIFHPKFVVRGKAIGDKTIKLIDLVRELLTETDLTDKKRLKEILQQSKSRMEMSIFQNGNSVASKRVTSYHSPITKYTETLSGLDYYWFVSDIVNNFDDKYDTVLENLISVYNTICNANNLVVSFTGEKDDFALFKDNLGTLTSELNLNKFEAQNYSFDFGQINEGIQSSSNVQYVAKGSNYRRLGYEFTGSMHVLTTILNSEFLHDRVRAKGGAYGCGLSIGRTGNIAVSSYRDPNLKDTLAVYDDISEFVKTLDLDQDALTKFIIGAISKMDSAMTPHMKGRTATADYIAGISHDENQKERDEILSTTPEDIRAFAPMIDSVMKDNYRCVLGNDNMIKDNEDVFDTLISLKK